MDSSRTVRDDREKYGAARLVKVALPAFIYALCGFFAGLCALPFGAYPFGIALLAAAGREAVWIFSGLVCASFVGFEGVGSAVFIGVYSALLLGRMLVRLTVDLPFERGGKRSIGELLSTLFFERVGYRVCASALFALSLSFSFLAGGGFLYYDLFGLLLSTLLAPLGTYVLSAHFSPERSGRDYRKLVGTLALFAICARGAADIKIYGVSVALGAGMLAVLCACRRRGVGFGVLCALAAGIAYSPLLCPIFVICALCFAVFSKISIALVSVSTFFVSVVYAFYARGIHALDGTVGGILCACVLFSVVEKLATERADGIKNKSGENESRPSCRVLDEGELDSIRLFDMNRRMTAISEGFEGLSELFEEVKQKFPRRAELRDICEAAFESSCVGCAEQARCRGRGTLAAEGEKLSLLLEKKGEITPSDIGEELASRCGRLPDIVDEINYNFSIRFGRGEQSQANVSELFGDDRNFGYRELSRLLGKSMEAQAEEYLPDAIASSALCEPLSRLDAGVVGVILCGARRKRIYIKGKDKERLEGALEEIIRVAQECLSIELDRGTAVLRRTGCADEGSLEIWEKSRFSLSCVTRSASACGENFCGDSLALFSNEERRFFAALSDGMGSGRDAALTAELATGFVRNMLSVGAMNREILAMLNSFLQGRYRSSAHECSTTLDLMEFDTVSGRAVFFKCGAAPTYVYRNGSLFKLRSKTMPLGILPEVDVRVIEFELNEGDTVVMMSDGVTGGKDECPYLFDLLRQNIDSAGSERTADLIMKYAKGIGSDDDISLAIIRVKGYER